MPVIAPHLEPAWRAFEDMQGCGEHITPSDVLAHCDLLGIDDADTRATIYRGVMALQRELNRWKAEQQAAELSKINKR